MTITDAVNTSGALTYSYPAMNVYAGTAGAAPPDSGATALTGTWCGRVVQSASGSRLDYADLRWNLSAPMENRAQPANFARMVDVRLPSSPEIKIARGDYVRESAQVMQAGDELTAQVQLRPYHFGAPLTGYWCRSAPTGSRHIVTDDIVFNPVVDGVIRGNKSSVAITGSAAANREAFYFAHAESLDTSAATAKLGETASLWSVRQAMMYLLWVGSYDANLLTRSEFIETPVTSDSLVVNSALISGPQVRDVRIPLGTYLPQALDLLLIPLGYNWYVDYDRASKPIIKLFMIGNGLPKEINLQAVGSVLNLTDSNCNQFSIDNAIGDSFNEVQIFGDYQRAEVTLPLYAAWPSAKDAMNEWALNRDGENWLGNESVWRMWIANEAGDLATAPATPRPGGDPAIPYFGTLGTTAAGYTDGSVFADTEAVHRRVLEEPLTLTTPVSSADRPQRLPHFVEYSTDAGNNWKPVEPHWPVQILPDQIGVYFDGHEVPAELYAAGVAARVRITGTVQSDKRVASIALKQSGECVNGRRFQQILTMPDRFQSRKRQNTGPFASVLHSPTAPADTVDHLSEITEYCRTLRDQNHFADVTAEFRLPGWHTEYQIGDLITKVAGREISLDAAPSTASVNRYVQIVERRFENDENGGPSTVLIVDRGVSQ